MVCVVLTGMERNLEGSIAFLRNMIYKYYIKVADNLYEIWFSHILDTTLPYVKLIGEHYSKMYNDLGGKPLKIGQLWKK